MYSIGFHSDGLANTEYNDLGLMGETVWKSLLESLEAENYLSEAYKLNATMESRAEHWSTLEDPFGSEQPWDSTAQEDRDNE